MNYFSHWKISTNCILIMLQERTDCHRILIEEKKITPKYFFGYQHPSRWMSPFYGWRWVVLGVLQHLHPPKTLFFCRNHRIVRYKSRSCSVMQIPSKERIKRERLGTMSPMRHQHKTDAEIYFCFNWISFSDGEIFSLNCLFWPHLQFMYKAAGWIGFIPFITSEAKVKVLSV